MGYLGPALAVAAGALVVRLLYWRAYREYVAKGDDYAAGVTAVAMGGTFLPFAGFAMMMLGPLVF